LKKLADPNGGCISYYQGMNYITSYYMHVFELNES